MTRSPCWLPILVVVLVAIAAGPPARADAAADAWTQARDAFAGGDYAAALAHFEAARDAGQGGPAVVYNIAVCQYKLEDYRAARAGFDALGERFPAMRALAQYNLGLVALKLDEPANAERHFRNSYQRAADQPKLRAMAATQINRLAGDPVPQSQWLRAFSARAGYDDNVILQDKTGIAADQAADSPFVEAFGTLRGPYPGWHGLRLDGGFFVVRYADVDEFNQAAVNGGLLYQWRRDDWSVDVGTHLAATTLGGDAFDRSLRLSTRVTRELGPASSLAVRYRYDDVAAIDAIFAGVEGSRQRVDLRYRWYRQGRNFQAALVSETNDRADPGVSPDKTGLQVAYRYAPDVGWGYGVRGEFRNSDYAGASPARDEDLLQFDLRITRQFDSGWQLFLELLHARNDSNDPAFAYERNQLSMGVYRFF
ncbi:MAG TPA: tetratricopeptide repeat protein [Woeseiaceae bacterium]|nr:tetratricopeptide repeat protein [Woeseiaceae bacterium]